MNSRCVLDQRQPLQMRDVIGARRPVPEIPWCAVCGAEQTQRLDAGKIISDGRPACSMASAVTGTLTPATMPIWVAVTMNDDAHRRSWSFFLEGRHVATGDTAGNEPMPQT